MRRPSHLRRHERLPLVVRVRFCLAKTELPEGLEAEPESALAVDLCEGGLFLRAPLAARLSPRTLLEIELDAGRHGHIALRARVAHHRRDGCGARFEPMDEATAARLCAMLAAGRRHLVSLMLAKAQRHLTQKSRLV